MSGYPERIEMKIRGPPVNFWLIYEKCAPGKCKTFDRDGKMRKQKESRERITLPIFATTKKVYFQN